MAVFMSRHPQEKRPRATRQQPFAPQPVLPAIELPLVAPPHHEEPKAPIEGRVPVDERGVVVIDFYI